MARSVDLQPQVPGLSVPDVTARPITPTTGILGALGEIGTELTRLKVEEDRRRTTSASGEGSLPGDGTSETERILAGHVDSLKKARASGSISDTEQQVRTDAATQNAINALPSRASAIRAISADRGGELQRQVAPFSLNRKQIGQVEAARAKKIVDQQTKADLLGMPVEVYAAYEAEQFTRETQKELNRENSAQWTATTSVDFEENVTALTRQIQQQTGSILLGPDAMVAAKSGIEDIAAKVRANAARTSLEGGWSQELGTFNQKVQKWVDREKKALDDLNGSRYLDRVNKFQEETIRAGVFVTNPNLAYITENAPGLMKQIQEGTREWNEMVAPIDPNDPKTAEAYKKAKTRWDRKYSHIDGMGLLKENWQTGSPATTREMNASLEALSNLGVRVPVTKPEAVTLLTTERPSADEVEQRMDNEAIVALFDPEDGDGMAMVKVSDPAAVEKINNNPEAQAILKTQVINKFNAMIRTYRQDAEIVAMYGVQKKLPFGEAYDMRYLDPLVAKRHPNRGIRQSFLGVDPTDITPRRIDDNYRAGIQSLGRIIDTFPEIFEGKTGQKWLAEMTTTLIGTGDGTVDVTESNFPEVLKGHANGVVPGADDEGDKPQFRGTIQESETGFTTGGSLEDFTEEEQVMSLESVPETAVQLIHTREGFESSVYEDSLGKKTVGAGHLIKPKEKYKLKDGRTVKGSALTVGDELDKEELNSRFASDANKAFVAASKQAEEAGISDPEFLDVLTSVNFQLGTDWTKKFHNSWPAIKRGDFESAIKGISSSLWAKQTPVRVDDFIGVLHRLVEDRNNAELAKVEPGVYFVNGELVEFS